MRGLPFRLSRVDIEMPGRELTSCILEPLADWSLDATSPPPKRERKLSNRQMLALEVLADLAIDGKALPAEWQMPAGIKAVSTLTWRAELEERGVLDRQAANPRADFKRLKESLHARHLIGERDGKIWKV